jgi:hypothetical protein
MGMNKKRLLRNGLIGLGAGFGVLAVLVATRPNTFHVERSITIAAPAKDAFARVNDFHLWSEWSPYEKLDPQLKRTFAGASSGVGAQYSWVGDKAGTGRMTIEGTDEASRIAIKLEFFKPFRATNPATFTFVPAADGTRVTWMMDGENTLMGKVASLFLDMDKLVGRDFERGLEALRAQTEAAAKPTAQIANTKGN